METKEKLAQAEKIDTTYNSTYADQIAGKINDFSNRRYSYDPSMDSLYQNYKKEYMTEAQKARTGVINQGLRLSGGYGNDFSQSVGEQQYKTYLANMNRLAPAFENLEYAKYQGEGDDLVNQLKLLATADNSDYGRNRDNINDQRAYRNYLAGQNQFEQNLALNLGNIGNKKDSADKAYELADYKQKLNDYIAQKEAEEAEARARASASRGGGGGSNYAYGGGGDDYYPQNNGLSVGYNVGTDYIYNGSSSANFTGVKDILKQGYDISNPATAIALNAVLQNKGYTQRQANAIIAQAKRNYRQN